jgi:hypothetical protein
MVLRKMNLLWYKENELIMVLCIRRISIHCGIRYSEDIFSNHGVRYLVSGIRY